MRIGIGYRIFFTTSSSSEKKLMNCVGRTLITIVMMTAYYLTSHQFSMYIEMASYMAVVACVMNGVQSIAYPASYSF